VDGILKNRLPVEDTKIAFDLKDKEVNIIIPEEILRAEGLQIMKHFIQLDVFKFVSTLEKVSFVETHINKQTQEKKPETKEKASEQKVV
jgi:FKBP-type peptidyl-prolyl cis-trans isomerase SlyD